jgi:hypothetical protein
MKNATSSFAAIAENLARQTAAVDCIYVFDGGDEPPSWLNARAVMVKEKLTIYQAWNVALSLVETPLVMNLNLDDRLAPDAVELLEAEILKSRAVAVGGDWKICYSQAETDAVERCYPARSVPFVADWPPKPGTRTRLGSDWASAARSAPPRSGAGCAYRRAALSLALRDGSLLRG